jgi:small-conductance mechanosensitive channel
MGLDHLHAWFVANRDGLIAGSVVAGAIIAGLLLLRWLGQRALERDPEQTTWRSIIGRAFAKTFLFFIIAAAADSFSTYADLPHGLARIIDIAFIVAFAFQGAIWAREFVLGLIGRRVAEENGGGTLGNAMAIIRVLVSFTLFAIAVILILDNLGVNVTALVAGLGIGGIAIGLAAQGIFSDLFAALSILFDKPFKKGDTIRYDNSTGTVERIGLKTTRIRSLTGEQLIMANTKLLEREIHNMAAAKARRMTIYMAISLKTAAEKVDRIPALAEAAVTSCAGCKTVRCAANGVGSGAISFELVYDDKSLDNNRTAANRSAVILNLVRNLQAEDIELTRMSDVPPPLAPF